MTSTPPGSANPTPFTSPIQFLAFGFGSGLSPKAPGTFGTVAALPLYWLVMDLPLLQYTLVLLAAGLAGIYICGRASEMLGVHDHPGIVWDEIVGFGVTLWAVPAQWPWILAGFVLFRIFDIAKPWPIGWVDRHVHGGAGIMVDDVIAGVFACALLHLAGMLL